ncbi:hypothetical protein JCM15519_01550 [Fundidesulfovibrio butyratiphilus]
MVHAECINALDAGKGPSRGDGPAAQVEAFQVGEWLRGALRRDGLTAAELAERAGLSLPWLGRLMAGGAVCTLRHWQKITEHVEPVVWLKLPA